jgi:ferric-dicitrate binding protein FerR (iron transport regulator)
MSYSEENDIEDLIGKFIVGEASEEEIRELQEWCALAPENQKYLDDAVLIYEKAQLSDQQKFDTERAWEKVKSKISDRGGQVRLFTPIWGIAAGLILVLAFSFLFYRNYFQAEEFQFVSENQVVTQTLPDQTELSLNQNSSVKVEYNEKRKTGTIHLTGEALISIPPTKKVEWLVEAGNLFVEDIGTVFHVQAYPDSKTVEVTVQEGMVRFFTKTQPGITLQAGDKGIYIKSLDTFEIVEASPNVSAFKTRQFSFFEKELREVVADLSTAYGQEIILDGNLAACKITVDFANEDLDTILSIIAETLSLEVTYQGNQIRISGEGCF